jgi:hypothetical protein
MREGRGQDKATVSDARSGEAVFREAVIRVGQHGRQFNLPRRLRDRAPMSLQVVLRLLCACVVALCLLCSPAVVLAELPWVDGARLEGEARVAAGSVPGALARSLRFSAYRCGSLIGSEWRDESGLLNAREEVELRHGDPTGFVRYRLTRGNVGLHVEAWHEGDRVRLRIHTGDQSREVRLAASRSLLAGPMLVLHAQRVLPELRAGRESRVEYLLADRGALLGLRLSAAERSPGRATRVRVEAASMLARPFVPVTWLEFDAAGRFAGMTGRLLPQAGSMEEPVPLDGEVLMRLNGPAAQQPCPSAAGFSARAVSP